MALDFQRLVTAAVDAALNEDASPAQEDHQPKPEKHGHSHLKGVGGLAAGAALIVAGRAAIKKTPRLPLWFVERKLPDLPDFDEIRERARDLWDDVLAAYDGDEQNDEPEAEDEDGDYDEAEADAEGEPEEDDEAEGNDEPEAEADADYDDEDEEADEDFDDPEDEDEPDEDEDDEEPVAEEEDDEEPVAEEEIDEDDDLDDLDPDERLDPAARPPKPPRRANSNNAKAKAR